MDALSLVHRLEDLTDSLAELNEVLSVSISSKDSVILGIEQDARIHAFLNCSDVLIAVLEAMEELIDGDLYEKDPELSDLQHVISALYCEKVLSQKEFEVFAEITEAIEVLSGDRDWLDSREHTEFFDAIVERIPAYYFTMTQFLSKIAKDGFTIGKDEYERH
jgi:hypothetical protein